MTFSEHHLDKIKVDDRSKAEQFFFLKTHTHCEIKMHRTECKIIIIGRTFKKKKKKNREFVSVFNWRPYLVTLLVLNKNEFDS